MSDFDSLFTATSLFGLKGSVAACLLVPNGLGAEVAGQARAAAGGERFFASWLRPGGSGIA